MGESIIEYDFHVHPRSVRMNPDNNAGLQKPPGEEKDLCIFFPAFVLIKLLLNWLRADEKGWLGRKEAAKL